MPDRTAGIVLAGGRSTRMGAPKATLEWHGSTLARRATGLVARAVDGPVVLVRAAGQALPALPHAVEVVEDEHDDRGPLEGIAAGLRQIGERATIVFVCGVDAPLLHPALIAFVAGALAATDDAAIPRADGFDQPLAAAYRRDALARALAEQLANGDLSMRALVARLHARPLDEATLRADPAIAAGDPDLDSLRNVNTPAEYDEARRRPAPRIAIALRPGIARIETRAATLAHAATAAGVPPRSAPHIVLAGHGPIADPDEPLAEGDELIVTTRP